MENYANVVLALEGKCWRMIVPDGIAKMPRSTVYPRSRGPHARTRGGLPWLHRRTRAVLEDGL